MSKAIVVGGNSGIGQAITIELLKQGFEHVYIVGRGIPLVEDVPADFREQFQNQTTAYVLDLNAECYDIFDEIQDVDTLIISAGFGRVSLFENLTETEIRNLIRCNELATFQIVKKYYSKLKSNNDFNCAVMVSIAGHIASPYFTVYGASKAGLAAFIENVNIELAAGGFNNRILDCSPGSLKGTAFDGGKNDLSQVGEVAIEIISRMRNKEMFYIPSYEEVYKGVLERYHDDPMGFGLQSYEYKKNSGRIENRPQVIVGYLSGTFDLFHIGHLNLLKRAKEQCDYLIVGVHESGSWKGKETFIPFEERKTIVTSIKYVDHVVKSFTEDSDAWDEFHYDKLFVGSDYKGTERFNRYEEYFKDKGVKIVYFPYTTGTSSTQLRDVLQLQRTKK